MATQYVSEHIVRSYFTDAMSHMYREEVPAYADLVELVDEVNDRVLARNLDLASQIESEGGQETLRAERHGAIRIGKAEELNILRRAFAIMGMFPVGYYDLSVAGLPVHSTAFRPVKADALAENPFRVFTSLLRLERIEDDELRAVAEEILSERQIVSDRAVELIEQAEKQNGLTRADAREFVAEMLETFRWHSTANVDHKTYQKLKSQHPLIADIVSFKGPHINHLTPRVLDIDAAQAMMPEKGLNPKETIEGPPLRKSAILLRQTAFKALTEKVEFPDQQGASDAGEHTARFGEIEQRGVALTAKGRGLYDELLANAKNRASSGDGLYEDLLVEEFSKFPDGWDELREQELAYFSYKLKAVPTCEGKIELDGPFDLKQLIADGVIEAKPIIYQDFLPVSAAGIFRSNLSSDDSDLYASDSNQEQFETDLGTAVLDPFELYEKQQLASIRECQDRFMNVLAE